MKELREPFARNGRSAAHLSQCPTQRQAAAKPTHRAVDDSVPIPPTSLSGDREDVIPDFEFADHPDLSGISQAEAFRLSQIPV
jgi:hypothetical protein